MRTKQGYHQADSIRILYIMGRGHSGSTVFDAILGNSSEIESVGELVSSITKPERKCSCGVLIKDCDYWQIIEKAFASSGLDWQAEMQAIVEQSHLMNFFKTIFSSPSAAWVKRLVESQTILFKAILNSSDKVILVDSSKELTRAFFLLRFFRQAKVVHLVRNPEGTLASDMHRINSRSGITILRKNIKSERLTPALMTFRAMAWLVGNSIAEFARLFFPKKVIRLRYEDLTADTSNSLAKVANFIDVDLSEVIDSVVAKEELSIGHNIGGNHMRLKGKFVFDPGAGSKRPLEAKYRLMASVICWPLMLAYGYPIFSTLKNNPVITTANQN